MAKFGFLLVLFLLTDLSLAAPVGAIPSSSAVAEPTFTFLGTEDIPSDFIFQKTRVGGLSGMAWDEANQVFWAVSDDRGRVDEPRVYSLQIEKGVGGQTGASTTNFHVKFNQVVFLKEANKNEKAEQPLDQKGEEKTGQRNDPKSVPKSDAKKKRPVLDLEGVAILPWGQLLFVNEGDLNQRPRANPRLMEFKTTGKYVRDYDLPEDFLAPISGQQKKGPRNNMAFEGLAADSTGQRWVLAMEAPLLQDPVGQARFLEYTQPEAWVLRPGRQWHYPLLETSGKPSAEKGELLSLGGISEILSAGASGAEDEWWVLERQLGVGLQGLVFDCRLYSVHLGTSTKLEKKLILNLGTLGSNLNRNFEGMAWGPALPDGRRVLIFVSDNNFEKGTPTTFAFFAVNTAATHRPMADHQEKGPQQ